MVKEQTFVLVVGGSSDNSKTRGSSDVHEVWAISEQLIADFSGQHGAEGERPSEWSRMTAGSS